MSSAPKALLIVHLTDLHISNSTSPAALRLDQVAGAIGGRIEEPTIIVLAITGDVAFSGAPEEYKAATEAIRKLTSRLQSWSPVDVVVVASPGNHDCDFAAIPLIVRESLLGSLSKATDEVSPLLDALAPTQEAFARFADEISQGRLRPLNPLVSELRVDLPALSFKFLTLNTAIASTLKERPGSLRLPVGALPEIKRDSDCCVVLAHHPLNWLDPQDAVLVSEWLDGTADLVLWGHEHRLDEFMQTRARTGSSVMYEIGLPLDDPGSQIGLKCLRVNADGRDVAEFSIELKGGECVVTDGPTGELHLNQGRERGSIRFSSEHKSFLNDPGAAFTHPRVSREVQLPDLFVAPDFREFKTEKNDAERTDGSVTVDDLCRHIASVKRKTVVFGAEQSGKTTFAKHLIEWLRPRHLVPIYLDGQELRSINRGEIRGWFNSAVRNQFTTDAQNAVLATLPESIVAIVDNVHAIRGGVDGIDQVLEFVAAKCGRLALLTADSPALSVLTVGSSGDERAYWKGGDIFELLPVGHRRRGELIRRWVTLGRNAVDEAGEIEAEVRQIKVLLDRLLGRDSLPKYPLFVLIILQQLEGMRQNRTAIANGSHGYLFEALISQAIDKHVRSHEIGTVNDFLSAVAYEMWCRDATGLTETAVGAIIQSFLAGLVRIDGEQLLGELDRGRILSKEGGLLRFRYNYVFYYYLAKWICGKQSCTKSDEVLDRLVELVHTELSSNVLMFVAHLQQEQRVISRLVPLIKGLYPEQEEKLRTLEAYSPLSLKFRTARQRTTLLEGSAKAISDETHAQQDIENNDSMPQGHRQEIEDGLKLNSTLKSIHTLGQVLKSRASSVTPDTKLEISEAIIGVSRRLMGFLYELTEEHAGEIVRVASDAFEKAFRLSRQQAVDVANAMIGMIVSGTARICVIRAAEAIGSSELIPLLDRIGAGKIDEDARLILLVARVSGEREYPKEAVEDFMSSLKPANVLPVSVLAHAVARRFYLEPPERGVRDGACKLLGIDVKSVPDRQRAVPALR